MEEELNEQFKPRIKSFVHLSKDYAAEEKMRELMDQLNNRAYKQLEMLLTFLAHSKKQMPGRNKPQIAA